MPEAVFTINNFNELKLDIAEVDGEYRLRFNKR